VQTIQSNSWIRQRWDNNNAKSVNNLLKVTTDWKQLPTRSLMDNVYDVMHVQYGDARRAWYGHGNFSLAAAFESHRVSYNTWLAAGDDRKAALFRRFLADTGRRHTADTVVSSDGVTTVPATPCIARKPGQRTRVKHAITSSCD